ncbi:HAD superfamily hydrolase [Actinobacillus ureae]|nr:haloacid dehalogenase-like hydrolase [Actinobacillus ureae ATCC 25976]SUT87816.1 HAD superfamily hydrolase [Actinobacillus ureae]SUU49526.1 HAD superfamily hydrolase [Actinobacillus ureae]
MGEADEILRLETLLKSLFPQLSIHRSKAEYLEIMNSKATKSKAIRFMQQKLGITSEHIVAFGDNFNDLDMLQYVGFGVAMANAPDEIKAAASYVTASNNEDGIALVLNKLFP